MAYDFWKKSKNQNALFVWTTSVGLGIGILSNTRYIGRKTQDFYQIGAICSLGAAIWFNYSSKSLRRNAILTYNNTLTIGPSANGIGLTINF